jgi:hypothetical protein
VPKELPVIQAPRAQAQPPIFAKVGIVGLGLIGGSIALRARELWPASLVIGVDNRDVLETAMRLHAIDVAADELFVLAEADLVILAAPVKQNLALLAQLDEYVQQPAVVTDTGSTKRAIVDAARALPPSRSSAAIRSAAPRRAASSTRGRICSSRGRGCSRRWVRTMIARACRGRATASTRYEGFSRARLTPSIGCRRSSARSVRSRTC